MAVTYSGQVVNGVIVLDEGTPPLPEGMRVQVEPFPLAVVNEDGSVATDDPAARTRAWMLALAREAEALAPELPRDLAENHDHYAHGKPLS
jgi:hypothetical protein